MTTTAPVRQAKVKGRRAAAMGALRGVRLPRRLSQLGFGLLLYGTSMALLVRGRLGVMPWDVLHQGLVRRIGGSIGLWSAVVGVIVLLLWIPLRERPGFGTVSNVFVIAIAVDAALNVIPTIHALWLRIAFVLVGLVTNAVATALYVGARLGPGPRDGLMTGLVRRTGRPVGLIRTSIEVVVVACGWLLGGTLGLATVAYALGIGPLVHVLLPRLTVREARSPRESTGAEPAALEAAPRSRT